MPACTMNSTKTAPLPPVWCRYVPEGLPLDLGFPLLGVVTFGDGALPEPPEGTPLLNVPIHQLGRRRWVEIWGSSLPVVTGRARDVAFAGNGEVLFGALQSGQNEASLTDLTREAYHRVLEVTAELGYPYLFRFWNYFPAINEPEAGLERYQRFCVGRQEAFDGAAARVPSFPAATAVGSQGVDLRVYFLAGRTPALALENPRQVSAYHYPPQYSPRQPAFSRAAVLDWSGERQIYISGTASIAGHQTRHGHQASRQTQETLLNIEALLQQGVKDGVHAAAGLHALSSARVYVRDPRDLETIRKALEARFAPRTPILYLQADICRGDLVVEIEGIARLPRGEAVAVP